jgi:hypothetical protein
MMLMVSLLAMMLANLRVSAFAPSSIGFAAVKNIVENNNMRRSAGTLYMAGFGAAASSSSSSGDSASKLKPKGQWDRYLDLKQATSHTVGVKAASAEESDNDGDWLVVGQVRCRDETLLTAAVARQRGLIADHAKRLFPLKVTPQIKLAWGYFQTTGDVATPVDGGAVSGKWVVVDPKAADAVAGQKDFDKSIGYEGTPDPSTGYYCTYNEGRLVGGTTLSVSKTGGGSGEPVVAKKSIRPSSKSK